MRALIFGLVLAFALPAAAQKDCDVGCACGDTCIDCDETCHVGEPTGDGRDAGGSGGQGVDGLVILAIVGGAVVVVVTSLAVYLWATDTCSLPALPSKPADEPTWNHDRPKKELNDEGRALFDACVQERCGADEQCARRMSWSLAEAGNKTNWLEAHGCIPGHGPAVQEGTVLTDEGERMLRRCLEVKCGSDAGCRDEMLQGAASAENKGAWLHEHGCEEPTPAAAPP